MNFYVTWRTSLKAILKNRKRSILTMIGIVIGIASVITIMSLGRGFEKETIKSLTANEGEEVTVQVDFVPDDNNLYQSNVSLFQEADMQRLKTVGGVKDVRYPKGDDSSAYKELLIRGKKENKQLRLVKSSNKKPTVGRDLELGDNQTHNKVVLVDSNTAEQLYNTEENALGRGLELDGQLFTIVGVFPAVELVSMFSMPESNIYVPKASYQDYFTKDEVTSSIEVILEEGATPNKVTTTVINTLEESGTMRDSGEYQVFDMAFLTDGIGTVLSTLTYFISAIAGISLFIAGVGVMNMMYISVSERTQEIGIRRAMGATEKSIQLQFLLEGVTLTMIGGIFGYILGFILATIIGSLMDIPIAVDFFTIALALGVSTAIGLIFSVMPASAAAKKDLIDILR
ncbi:ABC transporter permease [Vagococcus sp. BWB3-3]|uniref:ABC transporter permease n=1 Tax=Vagococcus allomyrinae TaxID=2794353 RepID=A0A940PFE5_9ENTE|nr:ABC transporter permease [Vagococcus allomyrinae]MBP1041828.1 ABC transporter permease [Vagococcus allomyrinae]